MSHFIPLCLKKLLVVLFWFLCGWVQSFIHNSFLYILETFAEIVDHVVQNIWSFRREFRNLCPFPFKSPNWWLVVEIFIKINRWWRGSGNRVFPVINLFGLLLFLLKVCYITRCVLIPSNGICFSYNNISKVFEKYFWNLLKIWFDIWYKCY